MLVRRKGEQARLVLGQSVSAATKPRLKVSREGIVLIKSFEGFRPRAVRGEQGGWIIGYGHTASAREGLTVGEQDAELLLQYDLLPVVRALNDRVSAPLNQHQFDALASFAVSVGVDRFLSSDVLQRLNAGHADQAADALIGWPEPTPPDAHLRRRAAERALFVADPSDPVRLADLLIAPLPFMTVERESEAVVAAEPAPAAVSARAAAVATLLGEKTDADAIPERDAGTADVAAPPEPIVFAPPAFAPAETDSPVSLHRYSPYSAAIVGPLPGFPVIEAPAPVDTISPEAPALADSPVGPAAVAPSSPSPFPEMDPALNLTPLTESDLAESPTPAGVSDALEAPPTAVEDAAGLPEESTRPVLRHEVEPAAPRRFDWSQTGMYLVMGSLGLAACAFSAAAFRLAVERPSPMGETAVIAWALAVIGVICVGVSSWNLYMRWGRRD